MARPNVLEKYGITEEQLKKGVDTVAKALVNVCDVQVALAVTELLCNADIPAE